MVLRQKPTLEAIKERGMRHMGNQEEMILGNAEILCRIAPDMGDGIVDGLLHIMHLAHFDLIMFRGPCSKRRTAKSWHSVKGSR